MKKGFKLFAAALMALAMFVPAQAAELTVFEGTQADRTVPINGYWLDSQGTRSQVIYPEAQLVDMVGRPINSIKFYLRNQVDCTGGTVRISLGTTTEKAYATATFIDEGLTQVASISMEPGLTELLITFDEPFIYNGGNLLFDSYVEEVGEFGSNTYFLGVNPYYNAAVSRTQLVAFIPQTTFDYTPADNSASVSPVELAFAPLRLGNEEVQTVVLKNTGLNTFTPAISLDAPFSTTAQPVALQSGESMEIPVKFAPTEEGNFNMTMTIDCGAAGVKQVALSGLALEAAEEITVCDGTVTSSYLPLYNGYYDMVGTTSQVIYPAETMADLVGKKIFGLTFYADKALGISDGRIQTSFKIVEQESFTTATPVTGMTVVANTVPDATATELTIYLDEPYEYQGGNLAIENLVAEGGQYAYAHYYGVTTAGVNSGLYMYSNAWSSNTEVDQFLPKATFLCKINGEQPQVINGDVNGDTIVNISDVTALINILLNGTEAPAEADCNHDTLVNISDVTALINYLLTGAW